jgi:heme/copper-type cytochrome/quinol oxidase subunit 3
MAASTAPHAHGTGPAGPVAHHFNNLGQQQATVRFGMWLFLVTEVLFFGGAFCAYTVYRLWFPKDFEAGSAALNVGIASVNTFLLLASSLTITLAIRSCYVGDRKGLLRNLILTTVLGAAFLGLKAREYYLDYQEGLIPNNAPLTEHAEHKDHELREKLVPLATRLEAAAEAEGRKAFAVDPDTKQRKVADELAAYKYGEYQQLLQRVAVKLDTPPVGFNENLAVVLEEQKFVGRRLDHISAAEVEAEMERVRQRTTVPTPDEEGKRLTDEANKPEARNAYDPSRVQLFFMFYYSMTGLHVLHMVVGLGLLVWQIVLTYTGFFNYPARYVYVETMSLYWHFVDMVWMFLLPLLYLAGPHGWGQAAAQFGQALGMSG